MILKCQRARREGFDIEKSATGQLILTPSSVLCIVCDKMGGQSAAQVRRFILLQVVYRMQNLRLEQNLGTPVWIPTPVGFAALKLSSGTAKHVYLRVVQGLVSYKL